MSNEIIHRPMITASEYAQLHDVTPDTVQRWAKAGLLPGAYQSPLVPRGTWLVPTECPRPELIPGPVPKAPESDLPLPLARLEHLCGLYESGGGKPPADRLLRLMRRAERHAEHPEYAALIARAKSLR